MYRLAGVCAKDETRQHANPGSPRSPASTPVPLTSSPLFSPFDPALLSSVAVVTVGETLKVLCHRLLEFPRL